MINSIIDDVMYKVPAH